MGWRDKAPKRDTTGTIQVGDGETVKVVRSGGYHRPGGWRDRQAAKVASSVKAGEGSRVTEHVSRGDIKNVHD